MSWSKLPLLPEYPWVPRTFLEPQEATSLLPDHLWVPGTFLGPQKAPSLLSLLPACSPCSQLAPLAARASLGLWSELEARGASWNELEQAPLASRVSLGPWNLSGDSGSHQLTPRPSLGPWNLPGASESPQLAPLDPSLHPLLPEHPWVPGASWEQAGAS